MLNEQEIINGCKKFSHSAQKALYDKYASLMRGVCMRYVRDANEVKDVVQEGFLKVFGNINQYRGTGSFEGWIKRIMINNAINYSKKNAKYHENINIDNIHESKIPNESVNNNGETNENIAILEELKQNEINPELVQKAGFTHDELLESLNKLSEPFRIVFNLHCIEHYKHEEIAEILNINTNTSRTRLLRARNMMKEILCEAAINKLESK